MTVKVADLPNLVNITDVDTLQRINSPDEGNSDLEGMYCIQTIPYTCSCEPTKSWTFAHWDRKIVVWTNKDDDEILKIANEFKKGNYDPKIVEYKVVYGKAVHWDDIPAGQHTMA